MNGDITPIVLLKKTVDSAQKARNQATGVAENVGCSIAFFFFAAVAALLVADSARPETHLMFGILCIGGPALLGIATVSLIAYQLNQRRAIRAIQHGTRVDPKTIDKLTAAAISLTVAVTQYNGIVERWEVYKEGCADFGKKALPNETRIHDAIVAVRAALQARAERLEKCLARREKLQKISADAKSNADLPALSDAIENLREFDEELGSTLQVVEDFDDDAERLLAEPILMANLDALDEELRTLPTRRAQPTNG